MKPLTLLFRCVAFCCLFSACSNSNDANDTSNDLSGNWELRTVSGSFAGGITNFDAGVIQWNFDTLNHKVTVVNNNTDESLPDILESGSYDYEFATESGLQCDSVIIINGMQMGCLTIDTNILTIDQSVVDGYHLHLER